MLSAANRPIALARKAVWLKITQGLMDDRNQKTLAIANENWHNPERCAGRLQRKEFNQWAGTKPLESAERNVLCSGLCSPSCLGGQALASDKPVKVHGHRPQLV